MGHLRARREVCEARGLCEKRLPASFQLYERAAAIKLSTEAAARSL